jgi:glycosyltransferase involved in cell wall biosynthesis
MTRVLEVLGRSAGGIARHVAEITAALDGSDDISVVIAGPPDLPVPMPKDVRPVVIPNGVFGHRRARRELRSIIAAVEPDVVHAHGLRAGIDSALAAKGSGAHVVVTVHNLVRPEVSGRLKALALKPAERMVVARADRVLAVSRDIATALSRGGPGGEIEVLHLGIEPGKRPERSAADVRRELGLADDAGLVVTASRLSPQKALHVMIEAMTAMDAMLLICGEGPLEGELRSRAAELKIAERVRFLGFRTDVADLIAAADVFCLSSVWEGVPLAAMEAVQLGTPVVATDVGGTGELIADRVSGRLVPPGDPNALAAALTEVLANEDARRAYVEAARAALAHDFSTERMLERLREIYVGARR